MTTFASDSFTGSDGTALSTHDSNWVRHTSSPANVGAELSSNRARRTSSSTTGSEYWYYNASPGSADYEVSADIHVAAIFGASGEFVTSCLGRVNSSALTLYRAQVADLDNTHNIVQLFAAVSGSFTQIGSNTTIGSVSAGSSYNLKLKMVGSTIELYWNGAGSPTISGSNSSITAAGYAGFHTYQNGATPQVDSTHGLHYDNFLGANFSSDAVTATASATLGALAAAGAATHGTAGSATAQLGAITSAGTGVRGQTGTAAATLPALTASASGNRGQAATASATVSPVTGSAAGVHGVTGAAAATLQALSSSESGTHGYVCDGLATLQPIQASLAGVHGVVGAVSGTLRAISAAAAGDFTFVGSIEGVGAATLHALTARGVGEHDPGTTDVGGYARPFPARPGQGISRGIADDRDMLEMLPIVIGVMNHAGR